MSSFFSWFKQFMKKDNRTLSRRACSRLVAYYWDGATPSPHPIRDITVLGAFLVTEQRWRPGTIVTMTLQKVGVDDSDPLRTIAVQSRVVRQAQDGVGLKFILPIPNKFRDPDSMTRTADRKTIKAFLDSLEEEQ